MRTPRPRTAGTSSASTSTRSAPGSKRRGILHIGRIPNVHADADRDPVDAIRPPSRLDEDPGKLAVADVQVVRPFQPDRRTPHNGPAPARRAGRVAATARRRRVGSLGRSITVIQMPCPLSDAHASPVASAPRRLTIGEHDGAGRRAVERARPCASSIVDAVESKTTTRGTSSRRASVAAVAAVVRRASQPRAATSARMSRAEQDAIDARTRRSCGGSRSAAAPRSRANHSAPPRRCRRRAVVRSSARSNVGRLEHRGRRGDRHAHEKAEHSGALPVESERAAAVIVDPERDTPGHEREASARARSRRRRARASLPSGRSAAHNDRPPRARRP